MRIASVPLIPYHTFRIAVDTAPGEAATRLAAAVAPQPWLGRAVTDRPFQGRVQGMEFTISRVFTGKMNSFVPRVQGRIIGDDGGSRLEGSMTLHKIVLAFMAVWSGGLLWGAVGSVREAAHASMRWGALFGVVAMLVAGWAFCIGVFTIEARKACRLLQQIAEPSASEDAA